MICYEVRLNGRRLCVAGAPGYGVLGANLSWVKRDPARRRKGEARASYGVESHTLQVGGLFNNEHVDWVSPRRLRAGDVVHIRVLRGRTADTPVARKQVESPNRLQETRAEIQGTEQYLAVLRRDLREQVRRERAGPSSGRRA